MRVHWTRFWLIATVLCVLTGCGSRPVEQGQQYKNGKINQTFSRVAKPESEGFPANIQAFDNQILLIQQSSPALYSKHQATYKAVKKWLLAKTHTSTLQDNGLAAWQMQGTDSYGNVQFTGYYTPIIAARHTKQGAFRYPLYRLPHLRTKHRLPRRSDINRGALSHRDIIGWSNSQVDNFLMEVQGSGYVDFGDGKPLTFFAFGGTNGWPYHSIGRELIDRGELPEAEMSMQAIRDWAMRHSEKEVQRLFETNDAYVFFKPEPFTPVRGASNVTLIAKTAVAADKKLIPPGSVLLAEVPLLNEQGKFNGQYQLRLMVALDVGGAIKGQHLDIYQGVGDEAIHLAGFYNHYGRVWLLKSTEKSQLISSNPFSN